MKNLLFISKSCVNLCEAAQATKTIVFLRRIFLDHLPSDVRRISTIYADESLDNLAQIADRLFDDERRAISQTDKSNFCSAATPVAELSVSLDHVKRDYVIKLARCW